MAVRRCLQNLVCLCVVFMVQGAPDNRGTDFIVGFMHNYNTFSKDVELFITTSRTTSVSVTVTSPRYSNPSVSRSFTVTAGQVEQVAISNNFRMVGTGMGSKAIQVTATDEVVVYGVNKEPYTTDAFLALPTDVLGTEYYAHSWYPSASGYNLEMMVVGVSDNTHVGIHLANKVHVNVTYNGVNYIRNDWLNLTMNKYDTLQLQTIGDITGSHIVSDKPIVAYSGNQLTNIASSQGGGTRDHLVEQLIPVPNWGKTFAIVPTPGRTTGDYYRIVACQDSTTIEVNGQTSGASFTETISISTKGDFSEKLYGSQFYASLTADKPVMVVQYVHSQVTEPADPAMLIIPPIEQYAADYTFSTPKYAAGTNYINTFSFIVQSADKNGLRINGAAFPGNTVYNNIPGTTLVGGFLSLNDGTYTVRHTSPTSIFGGFLFGRENAESYGFPCGMRLAPVNSVCTPSATTTGDGLDNDCDGLIDEEICTTTYANAVDDDSDGFKDEDCARPYPIDGVWASWQAWGSCQCIGGSFANGGTQTRLRSCTNPEPQYDGAQCAGSGTATQSCSPQFNCAVNGGWALWTSWTSCTLTCGGGSYSRSRTCTQPSTSGGGSACPGSSSASSSCNSQDCPIDGNWGPWSYFGDCSNPCGSGNKNRTRSCANPAPQNGGIACSGDTIDIQTCTGPCSVDGAWSNWLGWGACTKTCDTGIRSRSRVCNNPSPANGGSSCSGSPMVTENCNTSPCPTVPAGAYQSNCPSGWFTCQSGGIRCISEAFKCDCTLDCDDGSDEGVTYASCSASHAATCPKSSANDINRSTSVFFFLVFQMLSIGVNFV